MFNKKLKRDIEYLKSEICKREILFDNLTEMAFAQNERINKLSEKILDNTQYQALLDHLNLEYRESKAGFVKKK